MHIYFSGIGGTGLSPLANLVLDCGHMVSGSDRESSENTDNLIARGATINFEQSIDEITKIHNSAPIDWIITTSALADEHPHKIFANNSKIKTTKRHELINSIIKDKKLKLIAVAGTHGKTTTVGMIVWVMKKLKIPVSYLIGTNIGFGRSGEYDSNSQYFIYECDEFDRNFLNFEPFLSIIPSLDYDHPDTYKTEKDYCEAFIQFMSQSQNVISWEVVNEYLQRIYDSYNLSFTRMLDGREIYFLQDKEPNNQAYYLGSRWINLQGILIRRNALVALSGLASFCNLDMDEMLKAVGSFPGTQRRFEKLSKNLYSDYGHHPAEIFATLDVANEIINEEYKSKKNTLEGKILDRSGNLQKQKLVLVYQPHQNIRQHDLEIQHGYRHCFVNVSRVYWLPTYLSREFADLEVLSPQQIIERSEIPDQSRFQIAKMDSVLVDSIKNHLENGDMVIIMGAGDIYNWARKNL